MARITARVLGGELLDIGNASSVGELKKRLNLSNHTAVVNGETQDDGYGLEDGDYVGFSPSVKGGI